MKPNLELTADEQQTAMHLLMNSYSALSAAIRMGMPLSDDCWTKELQGVYDTIGDFLYPDGGEGMLGRKWGETTW